jgi:hypothetical protein
MEQYVLVYCVYKDPLRHEEGTSPHLQHEFKTRTDEEARAYAKSFVKAGSRVFVELYRIVGK